MAPPLPAVAAAHAAAGSSSPTSAAPRLSLTAQNEPLRTVLLTVGQRFGVNLALSDDVRGGFVTVTLHDATLEQALTAVLRPLGYAFAREHGVILVRRAPAAAAARVADAGALPIGPMPPTAALTALTPAVLPVSVISVDRAAHLLHALYPQASIRVDHGASGLIVLAVPELRPQRAEGKSQRIAMRALKRRLATVVYHRLRLCQARIEGDVGATAA